MPVSVTCPNASCGKSPQVSEDYLGRRGRCKSCGTEFVFAKTNSASGQSSVSGLAAGSAETNKPVSGTGTSRTGRSSTPTRLGRFQIQERVGMGGFGAVYRAQDPQLQRTVALKLLQSTGDDQRDQHRINRFLVEGRAGARLQHPNIVPVFDAGKDEESGEYYMAAAFITGQPLSSAIDGQPLDLRRAATIVSQLARALEYAHTQGILHRDVKPDNVMLDEKDVPHLMDFGLARMEESESHLTRDGAVMGTPSYMSPEQCVGKQEALGPAADQYSLGCLFYELLTGDKLFSGPVSVQIHHQINTEAPPPSTKNKLIPQDLDTICLKTLTKEPDRRYASCAELAADLDRWLADEPIHARKLTTWERWQRWRKRNPAIAGLSLGLAAALLIGLFGVTTQWLRAEGHARAAILAEGKQKKAAEAAKAAEATAVAERHATQKQLAESYVQRGRFLCEQDKVTHGLLCKVRGLCTLPAGEPAAERLIRATIGAWEQHLPKRILVVRHAAPVVSVRFSPDGKWFATASWDKTARIWETATGQPLSPPLEHDSNVSMIDISPDGKRVLTCSFDGTARLWNAPDGSPSGEPLRHGGSVSDAVFADTTIVTRSDDKKLHFWDANTGQPRREPLLLNSTSTFFNLIAVTPDGKSIVLKDADEIVTFDVKTGDQFGPRIPCPDMEMRTLIVCPDGQTILAGGISGLTQSGTLRWWELTGERRLIKTVAGYADEAAYSPQGNWLITGSERRSADDGRRVGYPWHSSGPIRCVAYHPHTDIVLTGDDDGAVVVWALPRPDSLQLTMQHSPGTFGVSFSPDDRTLLTAGVDHTARLWNATTGSSIGTPMQHDGPLFGCAFSPAGRLVATSSNDKTVRFWDAADGTPVGVHLQHPEAVKMLKFSSDGHLLLTACDDGIARLWNVNSRQIVAQTANHGQTANHTTRIYAVSFSEDNSRFATGCGDSAPGSKAGYVRIWDTKTCQLVAGPIRHPREVYDVQFLRSDSSVATACADGAVRFWEIGTSSLIGRPFINPSGVGNYQFHPSNTYLVAGCGDGHARYWDVNSQQQFGPDLLHGSWVTGLSFSSDGRRIATGSLDGNVRIWGTPESATGTPQEIERRIELATGLRLAESGTLETIDAQSWIDANKQTPKMTTAP